MEVQADAAGGWKSTSPEEQTVSIAMQIVDVRRPVGGDGGRIAGCKGRVDGGEVVGKAVGLLGRGNAHKYPTGATANGRRPDAGVFQRRPTHLEWQNLRPSVSTAIIERWQQMNSQIAATISSPNLTKKMERTANLETIQKAARPIDIIVPVYKCALLTARCLDSLAANIRELSSHSPRLIVINDSPGESDVDQVLAGFTNRCSYVTLLENDINVGFVRTVNRGLDLARKEGRDVIIVNSDTETFEETLKNIVSIAYSDPQIGFVSPRSNNASLCSLPHYYGQPLLDPNEAHRQWKLISRTMPAFHFVPTAVGFYLFIKHSVLANFGLLNVDFGVGYEEENDLILRANKAGYRAVLANNAFAFHAGSASFNLTDINLRMHHESNLQKLVKRHAEFRPLVDRYETSPHFRAEALLSHSVASASNPLSIVFDLSTLGPDFNGTNEMSVAIIDRLCQHHARLLDVNIVCSEEAFEFHGLAKHKALRRHDPLLAIVKRFAIAVRLSQPFTVHAISKLESLAAINIFGMLDTIAEDCGYLSLTYRLDEIWRHVARHANGLFFISRFSEESFIARHPEAQNISRYTRLLPTKLHCYKKIRDDSSREHVLIMGNHFAHKASDTTAKILNDVFQTTKFVVLGKETFVSGNLLGFKAGNLREEQFTSLMRRASIVVLPSHVEGFGFGFVQAMAAGKVVVARDIPATREIMGTYKSVEGVFLYADDSELIRALQSAMNASESRVNDDGAESWEQWVDGFLGFCKEVLVGGDVFDRLVGRIHAGDLLRQADAYADMQSRPFRTSDGKPLGQEGAEGLSKGDGIVDGQGRLWKPAKSVDDLLSLNGAEFVCGAYVTLFKRLPDSDGLENYLTELRSGVTKLEIIFRLKRSMEGRRVNSSLKGYRREIFRRRVATLFGTVDKAI